MLTITSHQLYTIRHKQTGQPIYFDGEKILSNSISSLAFIVVQAREKVRIDSAWRSSRTINDAVEIVENDTGKVVMEIPDEYAITARKEDPGSGPCCRGGHDMSSNKEWHYIEDEGYPPLDETVVAVSETWLGISMHLNRRVQRTGWGRTIECWNKDVDDIIAWYGPIPEFKKKEEKQDA